MLLKSNAKFKKKSHRIYTVCFLSFKVFKHAECMQQPQLKDVGVYRRSRQVCRFKAAFILGAGGRQRGSRRNPHSTQPGLK